MRISIFKKRKNSKAVSLKVEDGPLKNYTLDFENAAPIGEAYDIIFHTLTAESKQLSEKGKDEK